MTDHRCLDDELLAAYFDGLLTRAEEEHLHTKALGCDTCQESLASLALVIRETDVVPAHFSVPDIVTQRAIDLLGAEPAHGENILTLAVRFIEGALAPLAHALQPLELGAVATRDPGNSPAAHFEDLRFHVTLGDLPLEIDLEVDGPEELALTVRPLNPPPSGVLLRLACDGETRAVSSLGMTGATVSALPPGSYHIHLEQASRTVGQLQLELHR